MPNYAYIALTHDGKTTRGNIAAESPAAARHLLRNRHLHATDLKPTVAKDQHGIMLSNLFRGKRRRQLLEFTRQLATMVDAEIKLTEALRILAAEGENPRLAQITQNIRDQVMSGESLADAMKAYSDFFDPIYVAMVRVGEVTGTLGPTLKLLADYMGKRIRLDAKVKSALTYPAFLVVVCIIVVCVLMTVVVPRITSIIEESGRAVPGITAFLMTLSNAMLHGWWLVLLALAGLVYAFHRVLQSSRGKLVVDRLRLPVIGKLLRQSVVARFTSTLAALMRSGLPMAESLKVVADVTGNAVMTQAIRQARERIIAGADISTPLQQSRVVDAATAHMIAVGERAGELEDMLHTIAQSQEENADITVQRISAVIEPAVIVVMAVIVGFIMFGTLWPILEISNITM